MKPPKANIPGFYRLTKWQPLGYTWPRWEKHWADRGVPTMVVRRYKLVALFVKGDGRLWTFDEFLEAGWNVHEDGDRPYVEDEEEGEEDVA